MKDHIVRAESAKENCMYCGKSLSRSVWKPFHLREVCYLTSYCECGKKAFVRTPFFTSGHCRQSDNKGVAYPKPQGKTLMRTLESKIKVIEKKNA